MVQFSFDGMFRTTNKGLPDTSSLDPETYLTASYYAYSLIIQIFIALLITAYTALSAYRAFYKIKDPRFFFIEQMPTALQQQQTPSQNQPKQQEEQDTNDNLIYRFDEEEHEKEKQEEKQKKSQPEQEEEPEVEDQDEVSEQTTEWFLELDHQGMFVAPFLITFVVVSNLFAASLWVMGLLGGATICYFLFNVKLYGVKYPIVQSLFIIPCILTLLLVFFDDLNMST